MNISFTYSETVTTRKIETTITTKVHHSPESNEYHPYDPETNNVLKIIDAIPAEDLKAIRKSFGYNRKHSRDFLETILTGSIPCNPFTE